MAENVSRQQTEVSSTTTTVVEALPESIYSVPASMNASNPTSITRLDESGKVRMELLSEEDKQKYANLVRSININDVNSVINYGSQLQNSMNRGGNLLTTVRASGAGEKMETLINDLLTELDVINVDELKPQTGIKRVVYNLPIIRYFAKTIKKTVRKYDTVDKHVDELASQIMNTRLVSLRDNNALQKMFNDNIEAIKQIEDYIVAAKIKQDEVNAKLQEMIDNSDKYQTYEISDMQQFSMNLDRRISDLNTLHFIKKQSLPQIRLIQNGNIQSANKAQAIISTTIPLWRDALAMAVALNNQKGAIKAHQAVSDKTNELMRHIGDTLHENSIAVAKETERGIIEIETLRYNNEKLINTLKETKEIARQAIQKRREAEAELIRLENELESTMQGQATDPMQNYLQ